MTSHDPLLDVLNQWFAEAEAEAWETSGGACVMLTYDPMNDTTTVTGPYPDPVEGLRAVEAQAEALNHPNALADGDPPFRVTLHPLSPA